MTLNFISQVCQHDLATQEERGTEEGQLIDQSHNVRHETQTSNFLQVNTSNILKSTLTPRPVRKEMKNGSPNALHKSHSCSSIKDSEKEKSPANNRKFNFNNSLTVHVSL